MENSMCHHSFTILLWHAIFTSHIIFWKLAVGVHIHGDINCPIFAVLQLQFTVARKQTGLLSYLSFDAPALAMWTLSWVCALHGLGVSYQLSNMQLNLLFRFFFFLQLCLPGRQNSMLVISSAYVLCDIGVCSTWSAKPCVVRLTDCQEEWSMISSS